MCGVGGALTSRVFGQSEDASFDVFLPLLLRHLRDRDDRVHPNAIQVFLGVLVDQRVHELTHKTFQTCRAFRRKLATLVFEQERLHCHCTSLLEPLLGDRIRFLCHCAGYNKKRSN